ncbi:hypothetical protein SFRURICE_009878 [Spodoptera frugiperda]|nr:hypothetical protein SFRURICE_009878 [Spodoptera frugiperda]
MQRELFYPRRGRQRCTLRHVMSLYHVHPLFSICVISPITHIKSLTANRKLLKANPPLTSVTGDHHVQCVKRHGGKSDWRRRRICRQQIFISSQSLNKCNKKGRV